MPLKFFRAKGAFDQSCGKIKFHENFHIKIWQTFLVPFAFDSHFLKLICAYFFNLIVLDRSCLNGNESVGSFSTSRIGICWDKINLCEMSILIRWTHLFEGMFIYYYSRVWLIFQTSLPIIVRIVHWNRNFVNCLWI